ncbi:MAG: alpha-1,2-fucosyltransferase [Atribacterota bacterium]|nr:alpha-1,2-fucosyltransferase [Atribacterota bacterium]
MITCRLYGRLGNQMFQIAATIAHAIRGGYRYSIPTKTIDPVKWPDHPFNLPELHTNSDILQTWKEPSHAFTPIPIKNNLILDGYFQSPKYFEDYIDYIRLQFKIPMHINKAILGIHVRGGDYKQYPDLHPELPLTYYQSALKHFSNIEIKQVVVFTDDPELAKKYFPEYINNIVSSKNPLDDFYRMCMCEHLIIANSSYSLMAAIMNRCRHKIIVAPHHSQYFGKKLKLDTKDIYPKNFIQMKI